MQQIPIYKLSIVTILISDQLSGLICCVSNYNQADKGTGTVITSILGGEGATGQM